MRKITVLFIIIFFSLLVASVVEPSFASYIIDPTEIGVGARALGMGKAFTGIAADGSNIFINPAGLAEIDNLKITSMSGKLLQDIDYLVMGAAAPTKFGAFGIGYVAASTADIMLTTTTLFPSGTVEVTDTGEKATYGNGVILISYANELPVLLKPSVGASLKYFFQNFGGGSARVADGSGSGIDFDLGAHFAPQKYLGLGFSAQNFLPSSFGGKFTWKKNNVEEGIPYSIKSGAAIKLFGKEGLRELGNNELLIAIDADITRNSPVYHIGIEYKPLSLLTLRTGIDQKNKATETWTGVDNNLSLGVGLNLGSFSFDYAYHVYSDLSENTTHYFSLGFAPVPKPKPVPKPIVAVEKPLLKSFTDIPQTYWAREPIEYLATLGIIGGNDDGSFKPDKEVTRAELSSVLVKAKGFEVEKPGHSPFSDVPIDHWAAPYILKALQKQYISGYSDGTFQPAKIVDRAEAIVIISKFAGLGEKANVKSAPFPDIKPNHWAAAPIFLAKTYGLLDYLSAKEFEPKRTITRAEIAEILSKIPFIKEKIKQLLTQS